MSTRTPRRPGRLAPPPPETALTEAATALPEALRIGASLVAPSTLLVALLFYFGRLHAQGLFRYLRAHFTVFDLTVTDYLVRSADGLFVPIAIAAVVVLLLVWVQRLPGGARFTDSHPWAGPVLIAVAAIAGVLLVGVAAVAAFGGDRAFPAFREAGGLGLAIGVLLLAYAIRMLRLRRSAARPTGGAVAVTEWAAIFVLVAVGLFWAVNSYAIAVGTSRGQQIERQLATSPDVVLFSAQSLSLRADGVREIRCADPDALFRFRYEGLKFVLQAGGQYLFLPGGWTRESGPALVIPRSESVRLEFTAPGRGNGSC